MTAQLQNLRDLLAKSSKLASYSGRGMTSRQTILVEIYQAPAASGITFFCTSGENKDHSELCSQHSAQCCGGLGKNQALHSRTFSLCRYSLGIE